MDGVIGYIPNEKMARKWMAAGTNVIAIGITKEFTMVPYIVTDDAMAANMAAGYLVSRGFRKFAYCGYNDTFWSQARGKQFAQNLSALGFETHFYKQPKNRINHIWENEQSFLSEWLQNLPKPIGLMACNDDRGKEVVETCQISGIQVPEEIAVLGVDNDEFVCKLLEPQLSSVAFNLERAGYEAAELLDKMMKGEKVLKKIITIKPTHIITRGSTDIMAIEDSDVADAINFIRQNAKRNIQVSDVAEAIALSRRRLERRFRNVLNRSVLQEIRRIRVNLITQMLVETNKSISQIAYDMGLPGVKHISRLFKKEKGVSPIRYRIQFGQK